MYCDDSLSQHSIFQILFSRKASKEKEKEKEKKRKEKKKKTLNRSNFCFGFPRLLLLPPYQDERNNH